MLALQAEHVKEKLNLAPDMKENVARLMRLAGHKINNIYVTPLDESKEEQKENRELAKEKAKERKKAKEDRAKMVWDAEPCTNDAAVKISNQIKGHDETVTQGQLDSLEQARVRNAFGGRFGYHRRRTPWRNRQRRRW